MICHYPNLKNWQQASGALSITGESVTAAVDVLRKLGGFVACLGPAVRPPRICLCRPGTAGAAAYKRQGNNSVHHTELHCTLQAHTGLYVLAEHGQVQTLVHTGV